MVKASQIPPLKIRRKLFGLDVGVRRHRLAGQRLVESGSANQIAAAVLEQQPCDIFVSFQLLRVQ
jgi:hypothetical protein